MALPDQVHPLIGHAYRLGEVVLVGQRVSLEVSDLADRCRLPAGAPATAPVSGLRGSVGDYSRWRPISALRDPQGEI